MDDRELLEMAAKAAGYQVEWVKNSGCYYRCEEEIGREQWDPLEDDGDAFRLAVKLMLSVTIGPCQVQAVSISGALRGEFPKEDAIYQDMGIATRRAIVRAAAEIGRAM